MNDGDLVLVTGASGFVAKQVIKSALARGYRVRGTLRRPEAAPQVRAAVGEPGDRLEFVTADLLSEAGWDGAVKGCRHVLHVASAFPLLSPKDPNALVPVAREGTLRVLRAAAAAGVERTVLTSSCVSIWLGHPPNPDRVFTEADWTNVDSPKTDAYGRSKTLAEKAAWEFMASDRSGMTLAAINPSFILGPPLDHDVEASGQFLLMLLRGKYPVAPRWGIEFVDVRDVADAHVAALQVPDAAGKRFIVSGGPLYVIDVARALAEAFPEFASKMPRIVIPDFVTRLIALFDPAVRSIVPDLGLIKRTSHESLTRILGITPRSPQEASVAMARALIEMRLV